MKQVYKKPEYPPGWSPAEVPKSKPRPKPQTKPAAITAPSVASATQELEKLRVAETKRAELPIATSVVQDPELVKRYKALKKKARRVERLLAKKQSGAALSAEEQEKLAHADEIATEIAQLETQLESS